MTLKQDVEGIDIQRNLADFHAIGKSVGIKSDYNIDLKMDQLLSFL